ncbi:MAG: hypothetical protein E5Y31_08235 [Mesorhizobium sp.]|nr:MAG: hypothetical protein E5Y31_08235 [Mesorhizobium sp.]
MKHTIGYALIVFAAMTGAANSGTNSTSPRIGEVLHSHGSTGETTKSASNPDISSQVLDNGDIEKTDSPYNRGRAGAHASAPAGRAGSKTNTAAPHLPTEPGQGKPTGSTAGWFALSLERYEPSV